jgi:mono/diheme cytochrome c family protein
MSFHSAGRPIFLLAAAAITLVAASAAGDEPSGERLGLPEEVRQFLERDQEQRWASMLAAGEERFNEGSCAKCHAAGGTGGKWAPDLTDDEWVQSDGSLMGIRETIFWGVRRRDFADESRRFQMHPGGGMQLEWEEYDALATYVWSLSRGAP